MMRPHEPKREYGCLPGRGLTFRIIDTGAVVDPERIRVYGRNGRVEFRSAVDADGVWYGAFSVMGVGFSTGFAVVLPAAVAERDFGVRVETPVEWVEAGRQPRAESKAALLEDLRERALDWLEEAAISRSWYREDLEDLAGEIRSAELMEIRAWRPPEYRTVPAAEKRKAEPMQLSLF